MKADYLNKKLNKLIIDLLLERSIHPPRSLLHNHSQNMKRDLKPANQN